MTDITRLLVVLTYFSSSHMNESATSLALTKATLFSDPSAGPPVDPELGA